MLSPSIGKLSIICSFGSLGILLSWWSTASGPAVLRSAERLPGTLIPCLPFLTQRPCYPALLFEGDLSSWPRIRALWHWFSDFIGHDKCLVLLVKGTYSGGEGWGVSSWETKPVGIARACVFLSRFEHYSTSPKGLCAMTISICISLSVTGFGFSFLLLLSVFLSHWLNRKGMHPLVCTRVHIHMWFYNGINPEKVTVGRTDPCSWTLRGKEPFEF